ALVLPVPAPAMTLTGPRSARATSRCSGSSPVSRSSASGTRTPRRNGSDSGGVEVFKTSRRRRHSMSGTFTMYSTPWCGYCHRLKGQLEREGIEFDMVDIEQVPEAVAIVEQANNGNQTVPTLVFADGTALTNPSVAQVKAQLALS